MHFLSHYYIDRQKHSPLFTAGALLPDIAPNFTKTYNTSIKGKIPPAEGQELQVHNGILRHYNADAVFHNLPAFKEACANAKIHLTEAGLNHEKFRLWFMGHIITEVMLDRQLILNDVALVNEYYTVLSYVDISILEGYVNLIVSPTDKSKILSNFRKFLDVKFLLYLQNIEGAAEGVTKTMLKATGVLFSIDEKEALVRALHNIEGDMRYSGKKLLEI